MILFHFNPQYDSGAWSGEPGKGVCNIGESYVGPMGLLTMLEVRLGITAQEKAKHELLATYTKVALEAAKRNPDIFFAKSLRLTPLATAGELLKWRDELIFSGWKADTLIPEGLTSGAKSILSGLAEVESSLPAGFRTIADRWRILLTALEKETALDGFSVRVHAPENHMHPVHRTVLDELRRCGIPVGNVAVSREPEVEIKHFHDSSDACLWAAAQEGDALLVCSDDQTLSSAMAAFGRPYGNASASETPRPVTHLFTSAMMLLKDGGDIQAYRDYLTAPSHPLNNYKKDDRSLRETLLRSVISERGFKGFNQIIKDFAEGNSDLLAGIRAWIPEPGQPLTYDRVKAMCKQISDWASGSVRGVEEKGKDSPYLDQWKELVSASEEMVFQCEELGFHRLAVIPELDFIQVLRTISAPSASVARRAVVESAPVVSSIEGIAEDVQDVIWVDGSFSEAPNPMSFLCPKDISELRETLPDIWLQDDALQLVDDLFQAGLSHIGGKLTVLYCDSFLGKKREKHPFILRKAVSLRKAGRLDNLADLGFEPVPAAKSEPCPFLPMEPIPDPSQLEISGLALPGHMTPTKLEEMFDQPLDWVLKSILHLYEESDSNDSLIKGVVAHDTICRIYEKAASTGTPVDADAFECAFKAGFDAFFTEAVQATGAELNLLENKLDREQLKSNLWTTSIPKLIEIIRFSHLTIVGSEVKSGVVDISEPGHEPLKITGDIDLLLKDMAGHYVILDFKWAGKSGRDMRENQIRKGTDYQLALYRKLVETGTPSIPPEEVAAQAFFMLRTAELLTARPYFFDKNGPVPPVVPGPKTHQNTNEETLEEIHQKYSKVVSDFVGCKVSVGNLKDLYLHYKVLKGKLN